MSIFTSFAGFMKNILPLLTPRTSTVGASLLPSGTTAERPTGEAGHARHNTTTDEFEGFNGEEWKPLGGAATGAGGDRIFFLNEQVVEHDYTIPVGMNAGTFGDATIADGVTVEISDGSSWSLT